MDYLIGIISISKLILTGIMINSCISIGYSFCLGLSSNYTCSTASRRWVILILPSQNEYIYVNPFLFLNGSEWEFI